MLFTSKISATSNCWLTSPLLTLILTLVFAQCKKEDPEPALVPKPEPKVFPATQFSVKNIASTAFTAKIQVSIRGNQEIKTVDIEYSQENKFTTPQIVKLGTAIVSGADLFQKRITQLAPNSTYFVRSAIRVSDTVIYSQPVQVKTIQSLTFYAFEPDLTENTPHPNSPKMSFTKDGKGFTFSRNSAFTIMSVTEFDPEMDAWKHNPTSCTTFRDALFTKSDLASFSTGNRYFAGFGFSGANSTTGMNRAMFEFNLETGLCTELSSFTGGNVRIVETITHNDVAYAFTLESADVDGEIRDSLVVHEFDLLSLQWKRKAALRSLRRDLLFSFEREGKLYVIASNYGSSGIKTLFEYDINNRLLEAIPGDSGPTLITEQVIQANYRYNNKIYYISRDTDNQYLSMFDPITLTNTRLAIYPKETNVENVASSFLIGNTLYTRSSSLKFYAIDL